MEGRSHDALHSCTADVAVAFDVMEHVPAPDLPLVLREVGRIVKPQGRFLFSVGICAKWCSGFCSRSAQRF